MKAIKIVGIAHKDPFQYGVEFNAKFLKEMKLEFGDIVVLNKQVEAIIRKPDDGLLDYECRITKGVSMELRVGVDGFVNLEKKDRYEVSEVLMQIVEDIKEGNVLVSNDIHDWIYHDHPDSNFFRIINNDYDDNKHRVLLIEKHFFKKGIEDADLEASHKMKLSKYQRDLLGIAIEPKRRSITASVKIVPLNQDLGEVLPVRKAKILPVKGNNERNLTKCLTDCFIRTASLALGTTRPYEQDEQYDVVRISRTNLYLLGIDEGDKVIVSYGRYYVRARALLFNDSKDVKPVVAKSETDMLPGHLIGVPARLRRKLGIPGINYSVVVMRDTEFLFTKHFSRQALPLLAFAAAFLAAVAVLFGQDEVQNKPALALIALLFSLVVIIFGLFSELRSKVDKEKSENDL